MPLSCVICDSFGYRNFIIKMREIKNYDVVIVGGSYAGLSAAMTLGRAIRNVLVIDSGNPCNRQTPHSHNFLTQDGSTPAEIAAISKQQVMAYPTVEFLNSQVERVEGVDHNFTVYTDSEEIATAKKLIFSTGIKDQLPDLPSFGECWGISVIHCPYCHGYEYRGQRTGILANGDPAFEFARLINNWTNQVTVFTNGDATISTQNQQLLAEMNIPVVEQQLQEIVHENGYLHKLIGNDGQSYPLDALYARLPFEQHCSAPQDLGCVINEAGHIQVDEFQKTTVKGIYAAGDNSNLFRSVAFAVAAGTKAGAMVNHELISEG